MRNKLILSITIFNMATCAVVALCAYMVQTHYISRMVAFKAVAAENLNEANGNINGIIPILSSEFGKVINIKAKVFSPDTKIHKTKLLVENIEGLSLCKGIVLCVDKFSDDEKIQKHVGDTVVLSGYESIDVEGTPGEILRDLDIQDCEYHIQRTFVVLSIND